MSEEFNIRNIDQNECKKVIEIVRNSFERRYLIPSIYRGRGIEEFIKNELENKFSPYEYFVFESNDLIGGFAEFKTFNQGSLAFLNMIVVDNQFKGKKIAKKLFENAKSFFVNNGCKSIQLDVYASNTIAYNWYCNLGFQEKSKNNFYKLKINTTLAQIEQAYIQNYSQYKVLIDAFGFSFIEAVFGEKTIKLGVIENDLIIRGYYSEKEIAEIVALAKELKFENMYLIGDSVNNQLEQTETIIRMELNLEL